MFGIKSKKKVAEQDKWVEYEGKRGESSEPAGEINLSRGRPLHSPAHLMLGPARKSHSFISWSPFHYLRSSFQNTCHHIRQPLSSCKGKRSRFCGHVHAYLPPSTCHRVVFQLGLVAIKMLPSWLIPILLVGGVIPYCLAGGFQPIP